MFIWPATVARWVLQSRIWPSFPLSVCFLGTGSLVFSKFWHGARNPNDVAHDRIFLEYLLLSQTLGKRIKIGPNTCFFKVNFYWKCFIMKINLVCCVSVHNLCLVKILFLRYEPKCCLPNRIAVFLNEQNLRTN